LVKCCIIFQTNLLKKNRSYLIKYVDKNSRSFYLNKHFFYKNEAHYNGLISYTPYDLHTYINTNFKGLPHIPIKRKLIESILEDFI
jgi:hypothetical protein